MQNLSKNVEPPLARLTGMLFPDLPDSAKNDCELQLYISKYLLSDETGYEKVKAKLSEHVEKSEIGDMLDALKGIKSIAEKRELKTLESITDHLGSQRELEFKRLQNSLSKLEIESVESLLIALRNVSPNHLQEVLKEIKETELETDDIKTYSLIKERIQGKGLHPENEPTTEEFKIMSPKEMGDCNGALDGLRRLGERITDVFHPHEAAPTTGLFSS